MVHLRSARDLVDLRFAERLDLDRLAAQAASPSSTLPVPSRESDGETPANYLTRLRVERAKDLLRHCPPAALRGVPNWTRRESQP
jgi:transcriptional regulator GlxA family with amidase domain